MTHIRNGRREPQVRAKPCPICESMRTKVVTTMGKVRYCQCRECQKRWKQSPEG
jgi:formate dehydrogenase maturation protein FdhE